MGNNSEPRRSICRSQLGNGSGQCSPRSTSGPHANSVEFQLPTKPRSTKLLSNRYRSSHVRFAFRATG